MADLLTADAPGLSTLFGKPQWGIFQNDSTPILTSDAVAAVGYARDYRISDYPQEQGAFESYNKVKVPYQAKVSFLIAASRRDFLGAIEAAVESRDFVTIVTPEKSYDQANLIHYNYDREVRAGVTLIRVDVWCEEVRIVGSGAQTQTQSTNAVDRAQSGPTQTIPSGDKTFADNADTSSTPDAIKAGSEPPT